MRNKRLIILISAIGGVALLIIIFSIIFAVYTVEPQCKNALKSDVIQLNAEVAQEAKVPTVSIFLINEDEIIARVNENVPYAEMVKVERVFPNKVNLIYNRLWQDIVFSNGITDYYCSSSGKILAHTYAGEGAAIRVKLGESPLESTIGKYFNDAESDDILALKTVIDGLSKFRLNTVQPFIKELYREIDLTETGVLITTTTGVKFDLRGDSLSNKRSKPDTLLLQLKKAVEMYVYAGEGAPSRSTGSYIVTHSLKSFYSPL